MVIPIMRESVDQEMGCCFASEDWAALGGDGRNEEDAVGVHSEIVAEDGPALSVRDVTISGEEFQNGTQGLKAP